MDKFDIATFCRFIQEYRISQVYAAPPIVLHLAKSSLVNTYDLRTLRMITSGGAPLASSLVTELFQQRQIPVRQAYGLSETTSVSHIQVCHTVYPIRESDSKTHWNGILSAGTSGGLV